MQTLLYKIADSSLLEIYVDNADPHKPVYDSAEHMESEFTKQALRGGGGRQAHGARAPRRALPPGRHVASGDDAFRGPRARACVACAPLRTHAATCSGGAHTRGWPARRLYTSTRKRNVPLVASVRILTRRRRRRLRCLRRCIRFVQLLPTSTPDAWISIKESYVATTPHPAFDRSRLIARSRANVERPVYNLAEKLDPWAADQTKDLINRDNFVYGIFKKGGAVNNFAAAATGGSRM